MDNPTNVSKKFKNFNRHSKHPLHAIISYLFWNFKCSLCFFVTPSSLFLQLPAFIQFFPRFVHNSAKLNIDRVIIEHNSGGLLKIEGTYKGLGICKPHKLRLFGFGDRPSTKEEKKKTSFGEDRQNGERWKTTTKTKRCSIISCFLFFILLITVYRLSCDTWSLDRLELSSMCGLDWMMMT